MTLLPVIFGLFAEGKWHVSGCKQDSGSAGHRTIVRFDHVVPALVGNAGGDAYLVLTGERCDPPSSKIVSLVTMQPAHFEA